MKKIILKILSAALILCIALTACGNPEEERPVVVTRDPNVPANLVTDPPATAEPEPTVMTEPEAAPESETTEAVTEPAPETEPPETTAPETTAEETETVEDDPSVPDTRAMDCLKLFNSKKVHAKYIAAASYDGSEIYTTSVEYYIDGENAIYRTNSVHRFYQGRKITIIDDDNKFFMVYEDDPEPYIYFGYGPENYTLVSESDTEEVYDVESEGIRSTWTFDGDKIKVRDVYSDGSFSLYDVEILDSDTSGMDFTVPANYEEVDADDYEFYK